MGMRKFEFVAKTQILSSIFKGFVFRMQRILKYSWIQLYTMKPEAVPSINYIGRQIDVYYILVVKCTEKYLSIKSEFSMRHLAANISSPKVREIHDNFLWRKQTVLWKYRIF